MTQVMRLSISAVIVFPFLFETQGLAVQKTSAKTGVSKNSISSKTTKTGTPAASSSINWGFLEQAEDIEREAWWVLTDQRWDGATSPFRILRAALLKQNSGAKSTLRFKFCQKLKVYGPENQTWRVEFECQKTPQEIGRVQKLSEDRYRVEWRPGVLADHFGLGTSILFSKLSCEIDVAANGRLQKMSCPGYARNRNAEEIVELKTFEFSLKDRSLLKLKGDVKKDLHVVATIQTEVPLAGDIVVKEKQIPQKSVEGVPDFSDSKSQYGKKEDKLQKDDQKNSAQKGEQSNAQQGGPSSNQEGQSHESQQNSQRYSGQEQPGYVGSQGNGPYGSQNAAPVEIQNPDDRWGPEGRPQQPPPIIDEGGESGEAPIRIESSPTGR